MVVTLQVSGLYGGWTGGMESGSWSLELQTETMDFVMDQVHTRSLQSLC